MNRVIGVAWEPISFRLNSEIIFLTKHQTLDFMSPDIFVPSSTFFSSVTEDIWWCPARALKDYTARTQPLRGNVKHLFITTTRPCRPASVTMIARWLSEAILCPSAHQGSKSAAHETRSASTSWACQLGVPLSEIMRAACWKNPSTFISCYLKYVLQAEGRMGREVLQPTARPAARRTSKAPTPSN